MWRLVLQVIQTEAAAETPGFTGSEIRFIPMTVHCGRCSSMGKPKQLAGQSTPEGTIHRTL